MVVELRSPVEQRTVELHSPVVVEQHILVERPVVGIHLVVLVEEEEHSSAR